MKNLKFGVLAFGVLGLIAAFIPTSGFSFFAMREFPGGGAIVYGTMAGFAIAAVAGVLGVAKPPFGKPQAGIGLVGFIVALTMMTDKKPWKVFEGFKSPALGVKIMVIAALGGLVVSILALVKSEEA